MARLKVLKFGGSSLRTGGSMRQVAGIIMAEREKKAVVLSAVTGVTEMLVQFISRTRSEEDVDAFMREITKLHVDLARDALRTESARAKAVEELVAKLVKLERMLYGSCYIEEVNPRIRDYVQCFGERLSVIILSALLNELGERARPVDADELGIITDGLYGAATVNMEATRASIRPKLLRMLQEDTTPVITGFFGRAPEGSVTVFGRNGSDYSAAAVANAMGASSLEIWKDVDGFMSVDPKIVPSAKPIPRLSYDEAAELAYFGAKVVHPMTMEPARSGNIEIRVKNVFRPEAPGTAIGGADNVDQSIKSISCMKDLSLVKVFGEGTGYKLGVLADVASLLRRAEINIYSVVTSLTCIALLIDRRDVAKAQKVLAESGASRVETHTGFALMCIVGEGLGHHKGLASRVFKAVAKEGVNVGLISAGASLVAYHFTVDEADLERATRAVHEELFGC
ncbi:MAG TPA: aspartate kinase [Methanomassiliicoccales archaeon]|nr:aspartate kinase [Euryarchaeota archaeon]HOE52564.1 aspartate kinase [Methanomassiliicoccales archaeon]HQM67128.1 aspartate kinase [Methanomassiliicoccales archaeon]HRR66784.1 aspartate kinase [Methanomassiliicoccales archaeon]